MSCAGTPTIDMSQYKTSKEAQEAIDQFVSGGTTTFGQAMKILQASDFQCQQDTQEGGGKIWSCSKQYSLGGVGVVNYFIDLYPYDNDHMQATDKIKSTLVSRNTVFP